MAESKTYPIGTPITFIAHRGMCFTARQDDGKRGKVIGETPYGKARIHLLDSAKRYGCEGEWVTNWRNIKPLKVKGQQLEFSFME